MDIESTEFDKVQAEMWKEFIPMLLDAADKLQIDYKAIRNDSLKIIEFNSNKSGNTFHYIFGLTDDTGCIYYRFLSYICPFDKGLDFQELLNFNATLGASLYLDKMIYENAVTLKYEQPTISGYPDSLWFEHILITFDAIITTLNQKLKLI